MTTQAQIWYKQGRPEEAASEASRALEIYKELGSSKDEMYCTKLLRKIERERDGEFPEVILSSIPH